MKYYKSKNCEIEFVLSENLKKEFGCHNHVSNYVVGLVLQDCIELEKSYNKRLLSEGDIFIIPPYLPHSVSLNPDGKLLSLCIGVSFIENHSLKEAVELLQERFDRLSKENILSGLHADAFVRSLHAIYFYHSTKKNMIPTEISTVSRIIVENFEQDFTLNDLSERIYISKYYLIKKFKEIIGLTPHHFQIQIRIRRAQKLLCRGAKIAETAAATGFFDQSHFSKYFNQVVGITPREYICSIEKII